MTDDRMGDRDVRSSVRSALRSSAFPLAAGHQCKRFNVSRKSEHFHVASLERKYGFPRHHQMGLVDMRIRKTAIMTLKLRSRSMARAFQAAKWQGI
jgi:hypothetical protein